MATDNGVDTLFHPIGIFIPIYVIKPNQLGKPFLQWHHS